MIYYAQRKKKKLSYEILSSTQLLSIEEEIKGKVKVLYEGYDVKNVYLLSFKFINNGNQPISSDDFEKPLNILLNKKATILTVEIIREEPSNLGLNFDVNNNNISFDPLLLNVRDSFSIKSLVSDFEGPPVIEGRIKGVKTISKYVEGIVSDLIITMTSLVSFGIAMIYMGELGTFNFSNVSITKSFFGYIMLIIGMLLSFGPRIMRIISIKYFTRS